MGGSVGQVFLFSLFSLLATKIFYFVKKNKELREGSKKEEANKKVSEKIYNQNLTPFETSGLILQILDSSPSSLP